MTVRVVRVIEYVYDNYAEAEKDMSLWNAPANGVKRFNAYSILRSATTFLEVSLTLDTEETK